LATNIRRNAAGTLGLHPECGLVFSRLFDKMTV
jgi:hypothetical protein